MTDATHVVNQLNIIARDFDATLEFYRRLGMPVEVRGSSRDGIRHAEAVLAGGFRLEFDDHALARTYNAAWRRPEGSSRTLIGFSLPTRQAVDQRYRELTAAGYEGRQPPYDAFWGARYAVVADPDGNDVGLTSPVDEARRSWPPVPSPSPADSERRTRRTGSVVAGVPAELLFEMTAQLDRDAMQDVGATPHGSRRIAHVTGGSFDGPRLRGAVLPGGGDWLLIRPDGVRELDVRITLRTHDGHAIYMAYRGLLHSSPDVAQRMARGEAVDPSEYYFRAAPFFETGSERYGWLNRLVAVGIGARTAAGVAYTVYAIF